MKQIQPTRMKQILIDPDTLFFSLFHSGPPVFFIYFFPSIVS
nr:hypothetical protein Q903MT_gene2855 [Picea sitchensis]